MGIREVIQLTLLPSSSPIMNIDYDPTLRISIPDDPVCSAATIRSLIPAHWIPSYSRTASSLDIPSEEPAMGRSRAPSSWSVPDSMRHDQEHNSNICNHVVSSLHKILGSIDLPKDAHTECMKFRVSPLTSSSSHDFRERLSSWRSHELRFHINTLSKIEKSEKFYFKELVVRAGSH